MTTFSKIVSENKNILTEVINSLREFEHSDAAYFCGHSIEFERLWNIPNIKKLLFKLAGEFRYSRKHYLNYFIVDSVQNTYLFIFRANDKVHDDIYEGRKVRIAFIKAIEEELAKTTNISSITPKYKVRQLGLTETIGNSIFDEFKDLMFTPTRDDVAANTSAESKVSSEEPLNFNVPARNGEWLTEHKKSIGYNPAIASINEHRLLLNKLSGNEANTKLNFSAREYIRDMLIDSGIVLQIKDIISENKELLILIVNEFKGYNICNAELYFPSKNVPITYCMYSTKFSVLWKDEENKFILMRLAKIYLLLNKEEKFNVTEYALFTLSTIITNPQAEELQVNIRTGFAAWLTKLIK